MSIGQVAVVYLLVEGPVWALVAQRFAQVVHIVVRPARLVQLGRVVRLSGRLALLPVIFVGASGPA